MGVSERRPNGIFPPVNIVQMLSKVLPLTSPYGGFFVPKSWQYIVYMDLQEDRIGL